ncbi:hypothetical protein NDU88_009372 [Pleurodeles waltl]|uniref:Uncharacterized protein n=1 Tax=Pleurodeles waltl TaxID=8319 RepID=A0AAV7RWE3_PLEWA|nr:hypothetical protein NDU88_009372 [Pleurodeles waltl]
MKEREGRNHRSEREEEGRKRGEENEEQGREADREERKKLRSRPSGLKLSLGTPPDMPEHPPDSKSCGTCARARTTGKERETRVSARVRLLGNQSLHYLLCILATAMLTRKNLRLRNG